MSEEKLKKIIQKANSDILKLKFGCEVRASVWNHLAIETITNVVSTGQGRQKEIYCKMRSNPMFTKDIEEILGRPITLADILIAIRKIKKDNGTYQDAVIYRYWNLQKNNLDDQEPETIDFLYNLLNEI